MKPVHALAAGSLAALLLLPPLHAQEQIDLADARAKASAAIANLSMRVRLTKADPLPQNVRLSWRRGGEGLGGTVIKGDFLTEANKAHFEPNEWSSWHPLKELVGGSRGWEFPTIVALNETAPEETPKGKTKPVPGPFLSGVVLEFEFAEKGTVFKRFSESSPKGATAAFAFPGGMLEGKVTPDFTAKLTGLADYARARRTRMEELFPGPAPVPKLFGVIGHVGGYGEGQPGVHGSVGFGTRHCNPQILQDEFKTLQLLGVNGVVGSTRLADASGMGAALRRVFWGPPGSGSPMAFFSRGAKPVEEPDGCPYEPELKTYVLEQTAKAIETYKDVGAAQSWALWDDEIGVFMKEHGGRCERCAAEFRKYLQANKVTLQDMGAKSWDDVKPFSYWQVEETRRGTKTTRTVKFAPAPPNRADSLRYYYSYRQMTHATGQVFTEAAQKFKEAGVLLYAMQGPTPSWNGSSLDWHEFYDLKANTAFVFETSNRDARVWQWESYLADIGRGIAARHSLEMGCLIKPHRGVPAQRMLSVVSRGITNFEWYTYGPEYSKGDSFSQSPELLERVAKAARFLGSAEDYLYKAQPATQPQVAFVSPRSSEIWSRINEPSPPTFENAKWVYLALRHAGVPVDVLSEQQLAEGVPSRYKVLYIPGTHLRKDAGDSVRAWVREGGVLWSDAFGLARDEANQTAAPLLEIQGLAERTLESWGSVAGYRATELTPLEEKEVPERASFKWNSATLQARTGREPLQPKGAEVLASFSDGKPALVRNRFGKGEVYTAGIWSGISYSAAVRRPDFDMATDFDSNLRALIAAPALSAKVARPAVPSAPLVEAIALQREGRRSVALMNWSHARPAGERKPVLQTQTDLRVDLSGAAPFSKVRSLLHGPLKQDGATVVLPKLEEVDLLLLE